MGEGEVKNICLSCDFFCKGFNRLMLFEEWSALKNTCCLCEISFMFKSTAFLSNRYSFILKFLTFSYVHFFAWCRKELLVKKNLLKEEFLQILQTVPENDSGSDENSDLSQDKCNYWQCKWILFNRSIQLFFY